RRRHTSWPRDWSSDVCSSDLYYLGRAKYNENRFAEAVNAFQQCLTLDSKNVKAEDNLGLSYAGLDRNEEAIVAYKNAIAWQSGRSEERRVGKECRRGGRMAGR